MLVIIYNNEHNKENKIATCMILFSESYVKFKKSINEALPLVYDTKFLAREIHALRRSRKDDDFLLSDSNLFALYTNTNSAFELNMPIVELEGPTESYKPGLWKNLFNILVASINGWDCGSLILNSPK